LIGCGEQAASHLAALRVVRPLRRITVWGRNPERAAAFAARHGIEHAASIETAIAEADIVCMVTDAQTPLLHPGMLRAGQHINAVGASVPSRQEIATGCVPAVALFTDYLPSLEAQAAEVIEARRSGLIGPDFPIGEIGAVLAGTAPGRRDDGAITLYRSLGVAAQDLAAADYVLRAAEAAGRGVVVDMS
jgi:alanine dehydrogenase